MTCRYCRKKFTPKKGQGGMKQKYCSPRCRLNQTQLNYLLRDREKCRSRRRK